MMGAGKTTVGRRWPRASAGAFVDTDELIEARTGRTVREIFEADGEPAFRALETEALRRGAGRSPSRRSSPPPAGSCSARRTARASRGSARSVVWLRADPAVLARRAIAQATTARCSTTIRAALRRLLPDREPLYGEVADVVIDIDGLDLATSSTASSPRCRGRTTITASRCRSASAPTTSSSATAPSPSWPRCCRRRSTRAAVVTQAAVPSTSTAA